MYKLIASNEYGKTEKEVNVNVLSEVCDGDESGGGSGETNRPVPVSEFGTFVSEHHALGNRGFRESYEVSHFMHGYTDRLNLSTKTNRNSVTDRWGVRLLCL